MPLRPQVTNLSFTNQHFDVTGDMLILSYQMILFCLEVLNLKVGFGACSAEQEGIKVNPIELSQFLDFIKQNKLRTHSFIIGPNQYLVTSIHENWFCARCMNALNPAGEGAIVIQTKAFLLVALYDGSIGSASRAMLSVDQLVWQLGRRNL
ncbi:uncharacterized protein LOC116105663 isoform X1 [Pistacia vera]|uniref:uncharacterized protein LOC116105663 isoform X1 n=1 Tax=Pistacia vera TaxID=55513 RepID=UPI001263BD11|nr:uncharacterized protein LOC116105663 isoform X1 [Pistacia vera]XP_031247929.1 uncharacterized protein LOC116105663 isoform X1 [Pistacia vera]